MSSANKILDIAERRMRQAGYNAVSYRDIAGEMGIKSASLHYHFPKKENLGVALVQRYSDKFQHSLEEKISEATTPQNNIAAFVANYRQALETQGLICLCAVLGAEASGLPAPVARKVKAFFETNIKWLETQYQRMGKTNSNDLAKISIALLEGAMIVSAVNDDISVFNAAVNSVLSQ